MGVPPPKIDPWEAREKERARWARNGNRRSRRTSDADRDDEPLGFLLEDTLNLRQNYPAYGLIAAVVLQVLGQVASFATSTRTFCTVAGTLLLLGLLGTQKAFLEDMRVALRRGPNPLILGLLVWAGVSFFLAPYRPHALGEALRLLAGVGAYFVAAYTLRSPRQTSLAVVGLLAVGIVVSVGDMLRLGQAGRMTESIDARAFSIIGTHGNVGSLLALLVPPALAFAINTRIEEKRRLAALAASLVLGGALLLSRTRSAWIGVIAALVVLAIFLVRSSGDDAKSARRGGLVGLMESPLVMVTVGFVLFAAVGGVGPLLSQRAASALQTGGAATFWARLEMWRGGALMALERPFTGWGLGSFTLLQGQWTHAGDDALSVQKFGATQNNMAHNYYVQWAAETGGVGLCLHVAIVAAFFFACWTGLKRVRTGFQKSLLCGAAAAVAGASVDALASPAYHFSGVSTLLWVWMGLGIAAMRPLHRREAATFEASLGPTPWTLWTGALACGALAALVIIGGAQTIRLKGRTLPLGNFEVSTSQIGPLRAGQSAEWQARFRDAAGVLQPTLPGTVWAIEMSPDLARATDLEIDPRLTRQQQTDPDHPERVANGRRPNSRLRLLPRATAPGGVVTVRAFYRDRWGRRYEAISLKEVAPR